MGKSKYKDLSGQRFSHLLVLHRTDDYVSPSSNRVVRYACQCDCGRETKVVAAKLHNRHTRSCGHCKLLSGFKDLTGQRFDRLVVTGLAEKHHKYPNGETEYRWVCKCDCGKTVEMLGKTLKTVGSHQCSDCQRKIEIITDEEMVGQTFGRLVVIKRAKSLYSSTGTAINMWDCQCQCGNKVIVRGAQLRNGHTSSCGCYQLDRLRCRSYRSKAEDLFESWLIEHELSYESQWYDLELIGVNGGVLMFDFVVTLQDNQLVFIECHGSQHYQSVDFFGGESAFEIQQIHDYRKRQYCESHGFPLLEINCSKSVTTDYIDTIMSNFLESL